MTETILEEGVIKVRDYTFSFNDVVTGKQFRELEILTVKHDNLEKDGLDKLSREEEIKIEREWQEAVIRVGIKNETLESLTDKLSNGEIRDLVAQTYIFLERFGSISEGKQFALLLKGIKENGTTPPITSQT